MTPEELRLGIRSSAFHCIAVSEALPAGRKVSQVLEYQLIRSSLSGSANYRSATRAQSKAQFLAKLNIALEEVDESVGWPEDIRDLQLLRIEQLESLLDEGLQLIKF